MSTCLNFEILPEFAWCHHIPPTSARDNACPRFRDCDLWLCRWPYRLPLCYLLLWIEIIIIICTWSVSIFIGFGQCDTLCAIFCTVVYVSHGNTCNAEIERERGMMETKESLYFLKKLSKKNEMRRDNACILQWTFHRFVLKSTHVLWRQVNANNDDDWMQCVNENFNLNAMSLSLIHSFY